ETARTPRKKPATRMLLLEEGGGRRTIRNKRHESFQAIHSAPGGNDAVDDCHFPFGNCRLQTASGFRVAAGRLPHDPSGDVLSGCQSGCHGFSHYRAAGTAIWPIAGAEPDDFH